MATEIYLGNPPENIVKWIKDEAERKLKEPLCFTAEEPNATLRFENHGSEYYNQVVFSYDKQNWSSYEDYTDITLENVGDKVYFRAADGVDNQSFNGYQFVIDNGKIAASGNLNTLLKADGSVLDLTGRNQCYSMMFYSCSLTQAPELPATTLAQQCYEYMFSGCLSLTQAPALPAMALADYCYNSMFENTSLTQAPTLPATTLTQGCYIGMFTNCKSLTKAPALPATTLVERCYECMLQDCTSLTQAPELQATELAAGCYSDMFDGCSSIPEPKYKIPNLTFDEVAYTIQNSLIFGLHGGTYEVQCSDKILVATFDENEYTWTLTEK